MPETPQGTPSPAEPAPQSPQPLEQAQAAPSGQPTPAAADPQPTAEDYQRQLQQERQTREQLESNYKSLQGEFTRRSQALAQLTGNTNPIQAPPPSPVDQYAQHFVAKGYTPENAKNSAELVYNIVQAELRPVLQQAQIAQQSSNVDYAIQQAAQMAPDLFTSQDDWNTARQAAMAHIQAGGQPDPRLMVSVVNDAKFWAARNKPMPSQAQPPAPQPQPFSNGMFRLQPGGQPQFQPPAKPTGPVTPEGQEFLKHIQERLTKKPQ